MNHDIEQHKLELLQFNNLLRINPVSNFNKETNRTEVPVILIKQIDRISKTFGKFNVEIIKEADNPERGPAYGKSLLNSFSLLYEDLNRFYNKNIDKITQAFGKDNMFKTVLDIAEMTIDSVKVYFNIKSQKKNKLGLRSNKTKSPVGFKELFMAEENYGNVIELLIQEGFVIIVDESHIWKGSPKDSLALKKLLCVLVLVLHEKNYIKSGITNTSFAESLTQTFGQNISKDYYGKVKKEFKEESTNKIHDYKSLFYFIPTV